MIYHVCCTCGKPMTREYRSCKECYQLFLQHHIYYFCQKCHKPFEKPGTNGTCYKCYKEYLEENEKKKYRFN